MGEQNPYANLTERQLNVATTKAVLLSEAFFNSDGYFERFLALYKERPKRLYEFLQYFRRTARRMEPDIGDFDFDVQESGRLTLRIIQSGPQTPVLERMLDSVQQEIT